MLIAQLDAAFRKNPTPDGVAMQISDPLTKFIWVQEITPEQFESLRGRLICFRNKFENWESLATADSIQSHMIGRSVCRTYDAFSNLIDWAIIGYEHRLNPNLEWPPCKS